MEQLSRYAVADALAKEGAKRDALYEKFRITGKGQGLIVVNHKFCELTEDDQEMVVNAVRNYKAKNNEEIIRGYIKINSICVNWLITSKQSDIFLPLEDILHIKLKITVEFEGNIY